ncbi:MAG: hypothetical protein H3C36_15590 [Chitinophagaceae bacterium]|nr:hypothetical protein [Chitinophagaceae bacterium]
MNDKKVIAELRRSYNKLERQYISLRKENDLLFERLKAKKVREKETKRPAKKNRYCACYQHIILTCNPL